MTTPLHKITVHPEVKVYADMYNEEHQKVKVLELQVKSLAAENQKLNTSLAAECAKNAMLEVKISQIRKLLDIL